MEETLQKQINQLWQFIEQWLDTETKEGVSQDLLAIGIEPQKFKAFQKKWNVEIPKDFQFSYYRHNGFTIPFGLIHGYALKNEIYQIKQ